MKEVSVFDAKTHFSGLINRVYTHHESFTITRRGVKIAKIIPFEQKEEKQIAAVLRELQSLSEEIGKPGINQSDIKKMKEAGRR